MAQQEHVDLLKQGMKEWHRWLHLNLDSIPDLSGADLSGAKLSRMDLSRVDLRGADLQGARLRSAQLSYSLLDGANLSGLISPKPSSERWICAESV